MFILWEESERAWRTSGKMCKRSPKERVREWRIGTWARWVARLRNQAGNGSALVAGLVVLYGVATLGQQNKVPRTFWEQGHGGAVVLVALGLLAGVGSFVVTFSVKGLLDRGEADGQLITPCRDIAWLIQTRTEIPHGAVGVHVWQIAGPPFARRLRRRATFRAKSARQMAVLWVRGKGVLGQCWANAADDQLNDLGALNALDEPDFCGLLPVQRFNMTWSEFSAGKHYGVVWVTKLYTGLGDAPKLWGLLSVDIEGSGHTDGLKEVIRTHSKEMRALLDMCERLVA